jgi:hypothetical protein
MQHGTAREYVEDQVENVLAVLVHDRDLGGPWGDLILSLRKALGALDKDAAWGIDEPGVFKDGRVVAPGNPHIANGEHFDGDGCEEKKPVGDGPNSGSNPVGRIRDQRGLGR